MSSVLARAADAAARELELALAAQEQREVALTEQERWARDPIGWINDHVIVASFLKGDTSDRQRIQAIRMTLFPEQESTIAAWIDLDHLAKTGEPRFRNVVIEKSRQIGETVGLAATIDWLAQHHRVTGLCMHLKLEKIDDGGAASTWESLFGKIRYIDRHLDRARLTYIVPLVFKQKPSRIENQASGAIIHGKGQEDDPGRGDSLDFALIDEAAKIQHGELVHQSLASGCPDGKVYLSTPFGDSNMHARIADKKPEGWTYLRLHWSAHPVYSRGLHVAGDDVDCPLCAGNRAGVAWSAREPRAHRYPGKLTSPWYEREINDKTDEQVAAEYDIDREGSLSGRVYQEFSSSVHVVETGIPWDQYVPLEMGWDFGLDATSVVFIQDAPDEVRVVGIVEVGSHFQTTATPENVANEVRRYAREVLGVPDEHSTATWTAGWRAIGDPAGHSNTLDSGRPFVLAYRRLGFVIGRPPSRMTKRVEIGVSAVKRLLLGTPKPIRICGVKADALAAHLRNNVWPTDVTGHRRLGATRPEDNIHNHACDALRYWVVDRYPPIGERERTSAGPVDDGDEPETDVLAYRRRARGKDAPLGYGATL